MKWLLGFVAALMLTMGAPALAAGIAPADAKALRDYSLSMDKIKAMQGAMDDMKQLEKSDPAYARMKDDDDAKTLSEAMARFNADPKLVAVLRKHGLSPADVVLMPLVIMSAGVAVEYHGSAAKLSDQTSPAQIAFFKQHEKEIKATKWIYGDQH